MGTMSEKERNRIGVETVRKMRENQISKAIRDFLNMRAHLIDIFRLEGFLRQRDK